VTFVLGIDFGGTKVALATAGADGRVIRTDRIETLASGGAAQAVERAIETSRRLIAETRALVGDVACLGAGVSVPGIVLGDVIALAPNLPGLGDIALARQLAESLGLDAVACANDVQSAGLAESRWGALQGSDPALYLNLGTGLAAALLIGGRTLRGAHGAAGEIGYQLIDAKDRGASAGRAPLEEHAAGVGFARQAAALDLASVAELFASAVPEAVAAVDETLDRLAIHVANLAIAVDPERIAVGGGLMGSGDRVMAALARRLQEAVPYPPELVPARFVQDAPLQGALALILDRLHHTDG
jgi:glucokinase